MFSHKDTSEKKTGCVALEDVDKSTCVLMLKFMYTGEVLHQELGINLLIAADKYDIQDLKVSNLYPKVYKVLNPRPLNYWAINLNFFGWLLGNEV